MSVYKYTEKLYVSIQIYNNIFSFLIANKLLKKCMTQQKTLSEISGKFNCHNSMPTVELKENEKKKWAQ